MGSEVLEEEIGKALWIWGRRGDGVTGVDGFHSFFFPGSNKFRTI